jgi:hypothetical protein
MPYPLVEQEISNLTQAVHPLDGLVKTGGEGKSAG